MNDLQCNSTMTILAINKVDWELWGLRLVEAYEIMHIGSNSIIIIDKQMRYLFSQSIVIVTQKKTQSNFLNIPFYHVSPTLSYP